MSDIKKSNSAKNISTGVSKKSNSALKISNSAKQKTTSTTTKTAANGFLAGSPWVYTEVVKEHFLNPRNFLMGDESKYQCDASGIVGNPICGDQMLMMIKVKKSCDNYIIDDVKWKTYGCASAIASTSALSELAKGRTLDDATKITAEEIADFLGGLPKHKFHCSVLGHQALAAAVANFKKSQNIDA